jgi:diguanylate cyclase (GGDEF)-like protein
MRAGTDPIIVGLITQAVAIAIVAILSLLLTRSTRRPYLRYWTGAWICLCIALAALLGSFLVARVGVLLQPLYLLGEYAFGYLFIAGCQYYAGGVGLTRKDAWLLLPASGVAIMLPILGGGDFNVFFIPHAAIVAYLLASALQVLHAARRQKPPTPGVRIMSAALFLLVLVYLHYIPIFAYSAIKNMRAPLAYLQYTSLYDLILEVLLGFGTVMQVMGEVARELEWSNRQLTLARDRMEHLARIDPLTETLNRHGLYSFIEHRKVAAAARAGCLALVDMDNLKHINDSMGHPAGDAAIRALAKAIRSLIRPDDLLIRWGGDEFLVLLFGVTESEARRRLADLAPSMAAIPLPGCTTPVELTFSCGLAPFGSDSPLDAAIESADDAMYAEKQRHRVMLSLRGA